MRFNDETFHRSCEGQNINDESPFPLGVINSFCAVAVFVTGIMNPATSDEN